MADTRSPVLPRERYGISDGIVFCKTILLPVLIVTAAQNAGSAAFRHPVFVKPLDMDAVVRAVRALADC